MTATLTPMVSESALTGSDPAPCDHVGPYAWVDNLGHLKPIRCNRPRHHRGDHAYSTKRVPRKHTWTDTDLRIHTTSLKGPWVTVRRIE